MSLLWPIIRQSLTAPRRTAVVDDQRPYSYGQLIAGATFVAEEIETATSAQHVGILLPTSGSFPMALLGVWLAGRVGVPLNYLLGCDELAYIIEDSDIGLLITVDAMLKATEAGKVLPPDLRVLDLAAMDVTGLPPLRWPQTLADEDLAAVLYTSGTSGRPKGVMLTHGNLHSNTDAAIQHTRISRDDTFLGVLPQFHSFGLTALTLMPLRAGAKVVYSARFVPRRVVRLIAEHRPQIIMAVPSMFGALLSVRGATPEDFASIRFAISGGEPLPQATAAAFADRFGVHLLEGYGLTETSPVANWCTPEKFKPHSVGTAVPGVTNLVVSDADRVLGPNEEGEILISGPNLMAGYYHLPDETAEAFVHIADPATGKRRKYLRSGDIGHIDQDGYLFITGRKKEMLIIGGENVFPRQIEEVMNRHPSVCDSAVIGQPDGMRGEVPIAFVQLQPEATFDEAELREFCRLQLAQFKVPRRIRPIDQLPRNPTGKLLRRRLQQLWHDQKAEQVAATARQADQ